MAITFPSNPVINDTYTYGSTTWKWNGAAWLKQLNNSSDFVLFDNTTNTFTTSKTATNVTPMLVPGGVSIYRIVTTSSTLTAADNKKTIAIDTSSGALTITLPTTPVANDYVEFVDPNGTWNTNKVTVTASKIYSMANTSVALDVSGIKVTFVYVNSTIGWTLVNSTGIADISKSLFADTAMTGDVTVNNKPVVVYDFNTMSYMIGGDRISKMQSPCTITYDLSGRVSSYTTEGDTYIISYDSGGSVISITNGAETNKILYNATKQVTAITLE